MRSLPLKELRQECAFRASEQGEGEEPAFDNDSNQEAHPPSPVTPNLPLGTEWSSESTSIRTFARPRGHAQPAVHSQAILSAAGKP